MTGWDLDRQRKGKKGYSWYKKEHPPSESLGRRTILMNVLVL